MAIPPVTLNIIYFALVTFCKNEATTSDFETVKNQIIQRLMQENQEKKYLDLIKELEIYPTKGWLEIIQDWLDYKKSRREEYKRMQDVKKFTNELIKLSGNSLHTAKQIVDKSIICCWKGIFPLNDNKNKNNGYLGKYNGFF